MFSCFSHNNFVDFWYHAMLHHFLTYGINTTRFSMLIVHCWPFALTCRVGHHTGVRTGSNVPNWLLRWQMTSANIQRRHAYGSWVKLGCTAHVQCAVIRGSCLALLNRLIMCIKLHTRNRCNRMQIASNYMAFATFGNLSSFNAFNALKHQYNIEWKLVLCSLEIWDLCIQIWNQCWVISELRGISKEGRLVIKPAINKIKLMF